MEQDLPLGAHLVTPRRGYCHHGIYVGSGTVVHYAGMHRLRLHGTVEETCIADFARGRGYRVLNHATPAFSWEEIIKRARSRLGENRYSLMSNNCEHFAEWCISGKARSVQIETFIQRLTSKLSKSARIFGHSLPQQQM